MKAILSSKNDPRGLAAFSVSGFSNLKKTIQCVVGLELIVVIY